VYVWLHVHVRVYVCFCAHVVSVTSVRSSTCSIKGGPTAKNSLALLLL
jgi:hypothetical protein